MNTFKSKIIICDDIWEDTLNEFFSNLLVNTEERITVALCQILGPLIQEVESGRVQKMARILEKMSHEEIMSETGLFLV